MRRLAVAAMRVLAWIAFAAFFALVALDSLMSAARGGVSSGAPASVSPPVTRAESDGESTSTLTAAAHAIDLDRRRAGSAGNAIIRRARLAAWRLE